MNFVYDLADLSANPPPSRILIFLAPFFAPLSAVPLSFLSFLLVSTSGRDTTKIRAYVNVWNLVLVKLRICVRLFARHYFA